MKNYRDIIIDLIDGELSVETEKNILSKIFNEKHLLKEYQLQKDVDDYMRAKYLLEFSIKDAELNNLESIAEEMIIDHYENSTSDYELLNFKNNSELFNNSILSKEVFEIEQEMQNKDVDHLTETWVNEYSQNKHKDNEILEFISGAFSDNKIKNIDTRRYRKLVKLSGISIAASILLFFAVNILTGPISSDKLFEQNYETYQMVGVQMRSTEIDRSILFKEACELYSNKKFNKAIEKYEESIKIDNSMVQAYFYKGIAETEIGKYEQAIESFNQVILNFDEYEIESKWYTALCYLKLEQRGKSLLLFNELSETNSIYKSSSEKIVSNLN